MTQREDGTEFLPDSDELTLPDPPEDDASLAASGGTRSLVDDVSDLVLDAKTYLDAELSYQKTRATYVGDNLKRTIAFGLGAVFVGIFALIGLTVGLIIALTPLITAWGATAVVVGVMLLVVFVMLRKAGTAWGELMDAVHEGRPSEGQPDQDEES